MKIWIAHEEGLAEMGAVPEGVTVEVFPGGEAEFPSDPSGVEFWVPPYMAEHGATGTLARMTSLKVVQLMSAGAEVWEPVVPEGVTLCDAKGVHTIATAEWVLTAILSHLRRFPHFARAQAEGRWDRREGESLYGKKVLIVGAGDIGETIARRVESFEAGITRVARTARDGVHSVDELPVLLPEADIVVIVVPLTDATTGLVDAKFLAAMKDGAMLVNVARGKVADTDALLAETSSGRLNAALDVTDPEPLPEGHPLWALENVLITPHVGGNVPGITGRAYKLIGEQVRRFAAGEPLENVVRDGY
ncbi:2-hydroxyacid dehydrogenase [Phytomonospora endophytica]|uniref:Phosphoglycerate dehydrogenase-like enzyme n=1 Tax=Phytomonospora endophytica TaxID=714109 RepID=A0A841FL99_9ACTN|nr:2-hydroxyacid dehydrogenase [Phytomonospora endophytica]MBB6034578.1 phosphoglycerate dehydrogenase-like enzyme [Phytomonospora endophytica]